MADAEDASGSTLTVSRDVLNRNDKDGELSYRTILSPGDEALDLSAEEFAYALDFTNQSRATKGKPPAERPAGPDIRIARGPAARARTATHLSHRPRDRRDEGPRDAPQHFMQQLKQDHPQGFTPDAIWYRAFIAKLILFRSIQRVVKTAKFPAYQANIVAYTAALLAHRCASSLRYEEVWNRQSASPEFEAMILGWAHGVDAAIRQSAGMKMPTEWAKRAECWEAVRDAAVKIPATGIPELHA